MRYFKTLTLGMLLAGFVSSAHATMTCVSWSGVCTVTGTHAVDGVNSTDYWPNGVWIFIWDATSAPSSGTLSVPPPGCFYVPPTVSPALNSETGMSNTLPPAVATGIVVALSSTPCGANGTGAKTYTPVTGYISLNYE